MPKFHSQNKSYSEVKRNKFPYRKKYLEHNPGILGGLYFCSQCLRPLSRSEMEVDHIIPNSSRIAPNRVINCVAICSDCNKHKSDKVGFCTVKGIVAKVIEELYILVHKIILLIIRLICNVLRGVFGTVFTVSKGNSGKQNILMYGVIIVVILIIFGGVF